MLQEQVRDTPIFSPSLMCILTEQQTIFLKSKTAYVILSESGS